MRALVVVLAAMIVAAPSHAQFVGPSGPFAGFKSTDKVPVEIHADRMEADLATGKLRFIGHVQAKQGDRVIYAEQMDVIYTEAGKITHLRAERNVKVKMGEAFAAADQLVLDNTRQVIHLLGSPRVVQGRQIVLGEKMTYQVDQEKLVVTRPRIEWTQETQSTDQPREDSGGDSRDAQP